MPNRELIESGYYHIKPAANHILTVGKGIIKDSYTAVLELVKNSYDADAENVTVSLDFRDGHLKISIDDDGHGMDFETVTGKWMVPSTSSKLRQKKSRYKGRPLQGRKGIGRYAASILGDDLFLSTTDKVGKTTTELVIDWSEFSSDDRFLEDVKILIESFQDNSKNPGTRLEIAGTHAWSDRELGELQSSLKGLLSPFDDLESDFRIVLNLHIEGSEKYEDFSEQIKPLPVLDYYHYRVSGMITLDKDGDAEDSRRNLVAELLLENRYLRNIKPVSKTIKFTLKDGEEYCGDVKLDIRAFDLDEAIPVGKKELGLHESENLVRNALPGIAVIREKFRVRPYGDKKNDWLSLNFRRVNAPTLRLSNNQVAGFVFVKQEEESHLVEKATREGFKEDEFYEGLKRSILVALSSVEDLRYKFRRDHGKGRRHIKTIEERLVDLSSFEKLSAAINKLLADAKVDAEVSAKITDVLKEDAEAKEQTYEEIRKTIAQYQGQVTLGKIMAVVLHEGRKPLNALKQHPRFISEWGDELVNLIRNNYTIFHGDVRDILDKIEDRLKDNRKQSEIFSEIFKKLEPLASSKRALPKDFKITKPIKDAVNVFHYEFDEQGIVFKLEGDTDALIKGWEIDFYIAFTNLIENSIYWMESSQSKIIRILISNEENRVVVDYSDSGVGIDDENIESQDIFDPGYSTKEEGTGLGLSIAGEALQRNRGRIRAVASDTGANFLIEITK